MKRSKAQNNVLRDLMRRADKRYTLRYTEPSRSERVLARDGLITITPDGKGSYVVILTPHWNHIDPDNLEDKLFQL